MVSVVIISTIFKYTTKKKFFSEHKYHSSVTNKYIFWLMSSLLIKFYQSTRIFSFQTITLAIQPVSELMLITLFSLFKRDEDCFRCF
jgi:hypothetical protein